ncbi:MAG: phosphoribosyltransferase family protein [bacterium]|nr:phosphoribosyltransferase family protein [bacterium]
MKSPLGKTCIGCQNWSLDNLFVVSDYKNKVLEKIIKAFKYRFVVDLAESFHPLVKKYIHFLAKDKHFSILADNPLVISVPLHYRRFNWRGFNQAEIIAKMIAKITNLRVEDGTLIRLSISRPQAEIDKKSERLENMRNQFKISTNKNIKGKTLLLIDDVCTTGATLNECARILKESGAKKVIGFVIARG